MLNKKLKAMVQVIDADGNVSIELFGPTSMMCILDSVIRKYYEDHNMPTNDIPEPCYTTKSVSIEDIEEILARFREVWEQADMRVYKALRIIGKNADIIGIADDN